jgi:hypothetical protein
MATDYVPTEKTSSFVSFHIHPDPLFRKTSNRRMS